MKTIFGGKTGLVLLLLVVLLLAGLPVAVWLDLTNLAETNLKRQASDLNSIISSVRSYYASNVVGRILAAPGVPTKVAHNYETIPGAIPIPATLSLELGKVISEQQHNITYRFVSDYPFANRAPHPLDEFEADALRRLRENPNQMISADTTSLAADKVRLVAPVVMGAPCVACHNSHPESPKRDWKVGDVRGLQEVTITQPIGNDLFAFKYLLAYFVLVAAVGFIFIALQRRQAAVIQAMNGELETANEFLASMSMKISRYLSPQIYKSIFSGQKDVTIHTERKRLTIFFSDIKDFTATTERLQPEQITELLNEYFTEMSKIALVARRHDRQVRRRRHADLLRRSGDQGRRRRRQGLPTHGDRDAGSDRRAQRQMAQCRHRASVPRPHGHQQRLLQCRQFRQRRPNGLHDHRGGSEFGGAPAIDRRTGPHRDQLRNLRAGARYRGGARAGSPLP